MDRLKEHVYVCEEIEEIRVQQITVNRAAELASRLVNEGSTEHYIIYNPLGNRSYLNDIDIDVNEDSILLEQGWAERPPDGETVGTNFEPRYRPLVDRWYDIGEVYKERRMTAAMMVRTIRAMFPNNYDYPSERHVKNRITPRCGAEARRKKRDLEASEVVQVDVPSAPSGHEVDDGGRTGGLHDERTVAVEQHDEAAAGSAAVSEQEGESRANALSNAGAILSQRGGYIVPPGLIGEREQSVLR